MFTSIIIILLCVAITGQDPDGNGGQDPDGTGGQDPDGNGGDGKRNGGIIITLSPLVLLVTFLVAI